MTGIRSSLTGDGMSAQDGADPTSQDEAGTADPKSHGAGPGDDKLANSLGARTKRFWTRYVTPGRAAVAALLAIVTGATTQFDNLTKTVVPIYEQYQYTRTLQKPY